MYLQLDTKFNPFTYEEMMKPLVYYDQAYNAAEAAYSDLVTQTEAWKDIANREKSPEAFEMYQRYSGDLERAVNDFSQGMTSKNKGALLGLKRRYASDIQPIANAYKRQLELIDEQRKTELANPTMLWERKASDMSLDDFIRNPNADYGRSISGAALSAQVAAGAAALAKEFRDNPEKMIKIAGGDYYEYVKKRGFSSEAILDAINNFDNASPILTQLVESAIDSSGIKNWADNNTLNQAYAYARQGLWNAKGQDEAQAVQNWRAQQNNAQKLQEKEYKPIDIVDSKGNKTGKKYDPKLRIITDKDGNIVGNADGSIGGQSLTGNPSSDSKPTMDALRKVSGVEDLKKLGYTPVFAVVKHKGKWYSGREGDDVPGVWNDFFTRTSLISDGGDFVYTPPKSRPAISTVVLDPSKLPEDLRTEIVNTGKSINMSLDEDIQILRISGQGDRKDDYDYVVFRNNANF